MKKQNIYKKLVVRTKGLIKSARIPRTFSKKNNNVFSNEKHIIMQVLMQKEKKHYRASICESGFSALKRKYSDMIYAKKFVSQKNELLCRVLAYNLGIIVNLSIVEIYFLQSQFFGKI